jgi:uncharacterized protein (DUF2267 family)
MTRLDSDRFVKRVQTLSAIPDAEVALRAAHVVISVLAEQLVPSDRARLKQALPASLSTAVGDAPPRSADDLEAFYERVSRREGAEPGPGIEHAQSVCRALCELLDPDALRHLTSRLPDPLVALFEVRAVPAARPPVAVPHAGARERTLAGGRPVSAHPLSAAAPDTTQSGSIAASANPHADTKLSSTRGTTQEREAETLAKAKPRPKK